jgi:hypothetical protein
MVKFIPLVLLAGMGTVVIAAPRPVREGLVSHDAAGKASVWSSHPALNGGPHIIATLRVNYVIGGRPGDKFVVELWLGRTGWTEDPYHVDTQEVTVPGENGGNPTEG